MTTLYLKYRPQTLEELDLKEVRESLKKIVKSGRIPHAFLFYGPKGSGKTSAARILAKIVNCESTSLKLRGPGKIEPCNRCEQCKSITRGSNIDVIELDAASHRGIDDIRVLRDAVKLAPAKAKKKVYIIDEAHMLTTEASNALLKTLEEPPEHVIFILATTNPEKLIDTIRSRTTNINFTKAASDEIVRSLTAVAKGEKLKIDKKVLELISESSDGSFRDAKKLLEQLILERKISKFEEVEDYLIQKKLFNIEKFIELLSKKDTKACLEMLEKGVKEGGNVVNLLQKVVLRFRSALMFKTGLRGEDLKEFSKNDLVQLIELFNDAADRTQYSILEQIPFELAIIEWGDKEPKTKNSKIKDENSNGGTQRGRTEKIYKNVQSTVIEKTITNQNDKNGISEETWREILAKVRPRNTSTEALLRASKPLFFDGKTLTLGVFYSFHKERLEEVFHRHLLEEVLEIVLGVQIKVECCLTEPPKKKKPEEIDKSNLIMKDGNSDVIVTKPDSVLTPSDGVLTEVEDEDIIKAAKEIFGG